MRYLNLPPLPSPNNNSQTKYLFMKKASVFIFCIAGMINMAMAQGKAISMEIDGDIYFVCRECSDPIPELFGNYKYQGKSEPVVVLGLDFQGLFQPHGMPANSIEFWISCDKNGKVMKKEWVAGGYQTAILVHYLKPRAGYKSDYDVFEVTTRPDLGEIQVLRERTKTLK